VSRGVAIPALEGISGYSLREGERRKANNASLGDYHRSPVVQRPEPYGLSQWPASQHLSPALAPAWHFAAQNAGFQDFLPALATDIPILVLLRTGGARNRGGQLLLLPSTTTNNDPLAPPPRSPRLGGAGQAPRRACHRGKVLGDGETRPRAGREPHTGAPNPGRSPPPPRR